jgi:hypothetical protein
VQALDEEIAGKVKGLARETREAVVEGAPPAAREVVAAPAAGVVTPEEPTEVWAACAVACCICSAGHGGLFISKGSSYTVAHMAYSCRWANAV